MMEYLWLYKLKIKLLRYIVVSYVYIVDVNIFYRNIFEKIIFIHRHWFGEKIQLYAYYKSPSTLNVQLFYTLVIKLPYKKFVKTNIVLRFSVLIFKKQISICILPIHGKANHCHNISNITKSIFIFVMPNQIF